LKGGYLLSTIKKSSFFLNRGFNAKNRFKMQSYLNEMSANGLHITKIGRFSCTFTEDGGVRYLYSICGEGEESIYSLESGWTHFCNYKGVMFYRRAVPADAVKLTRNYKRKQENLEKGWLNARLGEGLALIGKAGDEYIFQRTKEYKDYEYYIKHPQKKPKKQKDGEEFSPLGATDNLLFLTANESGSTYYFIKDERAKHIVMETRGKRLSDQLFAIMLATASAIGFFACAALMIYGLMLEKSIMTACLIGGGAGALICTIFFGIFFKKFQNIAEARRIRKEEKRLKNEEQTNSTSKSTQAEQKLSDPQNNNTVVMNVVMNNYGKRDSMKNMGIDSMAQLYDSELFDKNLSPALDPAINPAIAAATDPKSFTDAVMKTVKYGDASDTLVQGEDDDIWQDNTFGAAAKPSSYTDEDWISADGDDEEDDGKESNDSFPLLSFIGNALTCFAAVLMIIFGLRFGIAWLTSQVKGEVLVLLFSFMAVAFAPFMLHFGFTGCKRILNESQTDDDIDG
jgi:hypothetical protein